MHHFCTYFDSRFLIRALALHQSLQRHAGPFVLHALCLDDDAYRTVAQINEPTLAPISLAELEQSDGKLARTRDSRSLVEYCFTCTPALPWYLLNGQPDIEMITYLDADLYFFNSPAPVFDELADGSTLIIDHRHPPHLNDFKQYGKYNVGLLSFRNDFRGRACLGWWRNKCIEWCYEQVEPTRYADQKYLDDWPRRFTGVVELSHKGANLAPWNLANYTLRWRGGNVLIDDDPLIFYHFHHLKFISRYLYDLGLSQYGATAGSVLIRRIYAPYLRHLRALARRYPTLHGSNLRLTAPSGTRQMLRSLIYGRTLFNVGPLAAELHLEPLARPLLRLRQSARRAA